MFKFIKRVFLFLFIIFLIGLVWPQNFSMPVQGAKRSDYNQESFWYYPWGKSGTHKGIDIFAKTGTRMNSSTPGIVLYKGSIAMGGNVVLILGPKWRLHYYAHLNSIDINPRLIRSGSKIGTVGSSGNAKGKPPHLHYSIFSLIPYFWKADSSPQGWKKIFYLDPTPDLNEIS